MTFEVRVPRLGWSMESGVFLRWLKQEGEVITVGEPLFELEGEKATQEVEAVDAGVLRLLPDSPAPGSEVAVGQLLALIAENAETTIEKTKIEKAPPNGVRSSPRARRVAKELGLDIQQLSGTGRSGRVREQDVRAAARSSKPTGPAHRPPRDRRTIAKRMAASAHEAAAVTLTRRVDATHLVSLRQQFKAAGAPIIPSYTDIVAKLVAEALRRYPELAGHWEEDALSVPNGDRFDIGLAVDTEHGLLVPVLRDVGHQSLLQVAEQSQRLIAAARSNCLSLAEISQGMFTITNLGAFGVETFTPLINLPEVAILGLGAIRREAVIVEDERVVARDQLTLSLTFDHRALDGAPAARFLQMLARALENPSASLLLS
jgi:pyruvate dehydrogenase E2 component (dihydrolipoamide acetyltransferase)